MKLLPKLLLIIVLSSISPLFSNSNTYFQQEVHHLIHCRLDDTNHTLTAKLITQYINHSPDTLSEIYMHLWMNAFGDNTSAFARQLISQDNYDFHFASESERGGYTAIDFSVNKKSVIWGSYQGHNDIAVIYLDQHVLPGDTAIIDINYTLKFPDARFSRPGHHNQTYYATQWFPKPSVYDHRGWHPMPYLDIGEFYSEFGNTEVFLTLPVDYLVASTGILQNQEEISFLMQMDKKTRAFLKNYDESLIPDNINKKSDSLKTLHFRQNRVHDFAWVAGKNFMVLKEKFFLSNGTGIDTWVFFREDYGQWKRANSYLKESLTYMSEKLGTYPWRQMTAVQGITSGGANMEYPALTIIGKQQTDKDLESFILHETIHNWFYGILASNERKEPWMDEGFATYYEYRFLSKKYPDQKLLGQWSGTLLAGFFNLSNLDTKSYHELNYLLKARLHLDQPIASMAEEFSKVNYFTMGYLKAAMAIHLLEEYLGRETFDRAMKTYYDRWKFRHPYAADLKDVFEDKTGADLSWFFEDLVQTTGKIDLDLKKLSRDTNQDLILQIKNKGQIALPFQVSAIKNDEVVRTLWFEGFSKTNSIRFPATDYDQITIDYNRLLPEINRRNNTIYNRRFLKRTSPVDIQFLGSIEDPVKTQIFWAPLMAWNSGDGFLAGMAFYNYFFPVKSTELLIMPLYSSSKDRLAGSAWVYHNFYPLKKYLHSIRLGSKTRRYALEPGRSDMNFFQLENTAHFTILPALSSRRSETSVSFRNIWITKDRLVFSSGVAMTEKQDYYVNEVHFHHSNENLINPVKTNIRLEQSNKMLKASLDAMIFFPYNKNKDGLSVRFFGGGFLIKPSAPYPVDFRFRLQGMAGRHNYAFDKIYFGRSESAGNFWGNQIYETDGGFKYPTPLGQSWNWLTALNLKLDIPYFPLRIYYDIGTYQNARNEIIGSNQFPFVSGFQLHFFKDILQMNFPVFVSDDIKRTAKLNRLDQYYQTITYTIKFDRLAPFDWLKRLNLLLY